MISLLAASQAIALLLGPVAPPEAAMAQPEKTPPPAAQPEKKPAAEPAQPAKPADPSADDIIKDLEKKRGKAPPPAPSMPPAPATPPASAPPAAPVAPAAPGAPSAQPGNIHIQTRGGRLLRQGTFLVERRGRMVRSPDGDWLFTFDADAKGQADPTMVLMPCQQLETMEKLAERYGESLSFTVTGQVFVYHNRNYLLPTLPQASRTDQDIKTAH